MPRSPVPNWYPDMEGGKTYMPVVAAFTDRWIATLKFAGERVDYWDGSFPKGFGSLGLRLGARSKVFRFAYHPPDSSKKLVQELGRYPKMSLAQARSAALAAVGKLAEGRTPFEEEEPPPPANTHTLLDLTDRYLDRYAKRKKRTWQEDERILRKDILPFFGDDCEPRSIGRRDINRLLDSIEDRATKESQGRRSGARMADVTVAVLSRMFTWAVDREELDANPCLRLAKRADRRARERVLSPDELVTLWRVLEAEGSTAARAFQIMLLTLRRQRSALLMRKSDLEIPWWLSPAEDLKGNRPHRVYLCPLACEVIAPLLSAGGDWVFGSPKIPGAPTTSINKANERFRALSGIPDLGTHILRKTGATLLGSLGFSDEVVDECLGLAPQGVGRKHYNLYARDPEKKTAFLALGDHVTALLRGDAGASARILHLRPTAVVASTGERR